MKRFLPLLLLPAIALGNVVLKQGATSVGPVNTLVCSGAATCSKVGSTGTLLVTAVGPDGGSLSGAGACGANTWVSTLNATAAPTCTQPAFYQIAGQVADAQLDGGYSGVGACAASNWVSTTTRNTAPTCTQPSISDLSDGTSVGLRPAWAGVIHAARGDGDPVDSLRHWDYSAVQGPTPTQIGVTVGRCVKYRSRYAIAMVRVRLFGIADTTDLYTFGIYTGDAELIEDFGARSSVANTWLTITTTKTLAADTDYWWCVGTTGTGTTAGFLSPPAPFHSAFWGAGAVPIGGRSVQLPEYAQIAVDGGEFPDPMPSIAAPAYSGGSTGSVPFAIFDTSTGDPG